MTVPTRWVWVLVSALFAALPGGDRLTAQQPTDRPTAPRQEPGGPSVFQGGVELVQLTVTVLDAHRQPVRNLTAADFTVLDNGVPSPIRIFTPVELLEPRQATVASAAWTRDVPSDVATNQISEQPGRLVVIFMDRAIQYGSKSVTAKRTAISIVNALGPNDLATFLSTSIKARPQNFTSDRTHLLRSINQRDWGNFTDKGPWNVEASMADTACLCGLCTLEALTRVADALQNTPGRAKTLFFIGEGLVVQARMRAPNADPGCDRLVRDARIKMLDAVARSGLVIHSIDPSSLEAVGPQTRADETPQAVSTQDTGAILRRQAQQNDMNSVLDSQGTLHVLPDLTGGRTVVNRNMPEETVPDIFRESQSYYLVAVEAGAVRHADERRNIEVTVRRKDVAVSAQRTYVPRPAQSAAAVAASPSAASSAPLSDSLGGLLPDGTLPLTMAVAAFAGPDDRKARVAVDVDAQAFARRDASTISLQLSVTVVDQTGRAVASTRQQATLARPRQTATALLPLNIRTGADLPPGDYEVRAAIMDSATNATASVFSHILVPSFANERLSLSDVAWQTEVPTGTAATATNALPVVVTTRRAFAPAESIHAFLQVYQALARTDTIRPVTMQVRVVDADGRTVHDQSLTVDEAHFINRRADCRLAIPVDRLTAGEYLLHIDAVAGERSATRAVRFSVLP